jgi:hypothetical protein
LRYLAHLSSLWRTFRYQGLDLVTTILSKELKRQVSVEGRDYTISVDAERLRLTGKGKRKPDVELLWRDLLSGEAAMAVALNASLVRDPSRAKKSTPEKSPELVPKDPRKSGR